MDCLTANGCKLTLNEVFECEDIDAIVQRAEQLFSVLPAPQSRPALSEHSPHKT